MGHLGHLKAEYRDLLERLDKGQVGMPEPTHPHAREGWQEILEILFTPEEAALAAKMPLAPADLATISKRVGVPHEELGRRLDVMADKGIVMDLVSATTGKTKYMLSPPVVGFFEFSLMRAKDLIPKKRMAEALDAYTHGDVAFAKEVFGSDTVVGRAMVHENVLGEDQLPDVLDWERATAVIEGSEHLAVALCYCRHKAEHLGTRCDVPMETCLSANAGAEYIIRRGFGRRVERSEAMDILVEARENGLVQIADNVRNRPTYICNCCGCCCGQLQAINEYDLPAVNPSAFRAAPDLERCKGCSRCSRACPIGAITMAPERVSAQRKNDLEPRVDPDRCIGCGVCVGACGKNHAMHMERRPERPYVPASTVERSVRMALERGRLSEFIVDQSEARGSRFMTQVVRAICDLPATKRLLATEQVKSRFLRYATGNIADPKL